MLTPDRNAPIATKRTMQATRKEVQRTACTPSDDHQAIAVLVRTFSTTRSQGVQP